MSKQASEEWTKVWEKNKGIKKPIGYHIHHLNPRHNGGAWFDPKNLVAVSRKVHAYIHLILWKRYKREADRKAWNILKDVLENDQKVNQYELNGTYKDTHDNYKIADFIISPNCTTGKILQQCKEETGSYRNYQWRFQKNNNDVNDINPWIPKNKYGGHSTSPIQVIDILTGEIFDSKNKAAKSIDLHLKSKKPRLDSNEFIKRFKEI